MRIHVFIIGIALMSLSCFGLGATETSETVFVLKNKNMSLSPYTGMTREHWKEAALYLLEGAFSYVKSPEDPLDFPKQPGKSYPRTPSQEPVARLEALCRTMFLAGPLLKEDPELRVNGILLGDYYRRQLELMLQPGTPVYVPMNPPKKNGGQRLVELGGLALSFMMAPEIFWNPLSQEVKDSLAVRMLSYGEGGTYECNWRFFNVNIMSFFLSQGYHTDKAYLEELLQILLAAYRGDGWYHDNPLFDYYSMWAYQMYGLLWSEYFGKENYPEYAKRFIDNFKEMTGTYPLMFGRNGQMIMWGRSITYRFAAVSPFSLAGYMNDDSVNYGHLRRIASGTLLQFLQNPNLLADGVPTLGFYGAFEPAIQGYSCRGSVYWMGKAFLSLLLPESNPFWSAQENEGIWGTKDRKNPVKNTFQNGAKILITDYLESGISEIRTSTEMPANAREDWRYSENYNRLSYSSEFPWMADGANGEVAMNYTFKKADEGWKALSVYRFKRFEQEVYYREAWLRNDTDIEFQLADILLPDGVLRVDKAMSVNPVEAHLGHYALPHLTNTIKEKTIKKHGYTAYVIENEKHQLAMVPLYGWKEVGFEHTSGLHPESDECTVLNAKEIFTGEKIFVTLLLWNKAGMKVDNKRLFPVKDVLVSHDKKSVTVLLNDGTRKEVVW